MNFTEYSNWTDNVAVYPKIHEPHYLALGIAEEIGELHRAVSNEELVAEAGDVMWYCARYARLVLQEDFTEICTAIVLTPVTASFILQPVSIIAGVEKKRLRDGDSWDEMKIAAKHKAAAEALSQIIDHTLRLVRKVTGKLPNEILEANVLKLSQRKEASTIRGDGDHR